MRAQVEKQYMNEIMSVSKQMEEMNQSHNHLMHAKDKELKVLKEKLNQWDKTSSNDDVFYLS